MKNEQLFTSTISRVNFTALLKALACPGAFPFPIPEDEPIPVVQTHASAVLLTPKRVYKLKKPENLGFLNYSTAELRRHFCQQEVVLNAPLAPQIYLGVAPVLASSSGYIRFGPTFPVERADQQEPPHPGTIFEGEEVIDYAVVMVRLPEEATLHSRTRHGAVTLAQIIEIAHAVADFHKKACTNERITRFGALATILDNWEENFAQMSPYIDRTLDKATFESIQQYVHAFIQARTSLFTSRQLDGRIRDCHGDLRLQHIYLLEESSNLAILDRIEFNERFRYSDVASEVAFLLMELDAFGRADLSRHFLTEYLLETGDPTLLEILPFYMCYRACVRGKVSSFQLDQPEISSTQHELARRDAVSLFKLAASYAKGPVHPLVLMVGGLMGTSKSTLAQALGRELGWRVISSDQIRKQLAHLDPVRPQADKFGEGFYSPVWTQRTYDALRVEMCTALARGCSVLLDASFLKKADRMVVAREAERFNATVAFVECTCPADLTSARLADRWNARIGAGSHLDHPDTSLASDGRPELSNLQLRSWEPFDNMKESDTHHFIVATTSPLSHCVEQVLTDLALPHTACWLQQQ